MSAPHYSVTVTTVDVKGTTGLLEYGDTYADPAVARGTLQRRVDRNPWAVFGHIRLLLGSPRDADAPTVRHETVWPATSAR